MEYDNKRFAERLKDLREEKQLNRIALSKKLGISHTIISYWETNQREPSASSIYKLAKFFEVTADYLLGIED